MLTPQEAKHLGDYDQATADQLRQEREKADRPLTSGWTQLHELLDALEAEAMESIKESHFEIGVFGKCRETFSGSRVIVDSSDLFIRLAQCRIERDYDDIKRWRSYKAE